MCASVMGITSCRRDDNAQCEACSAVLEGMQICLDMPGVQLACVMQISKIVGQGWHMPCMPHDQLMGGRRHPNPRKDAVTGTLTSRCELVLQSLKPRWRTELLELNGQLVTLGGLLPSTAADTAAVNGQLRHSLAKVALQKSSCYSARPALKHWMPGWFAHWSPNPAAHGGLASS